MTWTISHGTPGGRFDGYHSQSYSQVGVWRDALVQMPLSGRDLSVVEPLPRSRSGDPFEIPAAPAAAERAAAAGEPWRWS